MESLQHMYVCRLNSAFMASLINFAIVCPRFGINELKHVRTDNGISQMAQIARKKCSISIKLIARNWSESPNLIRILARELYISVMQGKMEWERLLYVPPRLWLLNTLGDTIFMYKGAIISYLIFIFNILLSEKIKETLFPFLYSRFPVIFPKTQYLHRISILNFHKYPIEKYGNWNFFPPGIGDVRFLGISIWEWDLGLRRVRGYYFYNNNNII